MVDFKAGGIVTAGMLNDLNRDTTATLTLTGSSVNPSLGTGGTLTCSVHFNGRLYEATVNITAGTASAAAGTGTYQLDLPSELQLDASWASNFALGGAELNDGGTAYPLEIRSSSASRLIFRHLGNATHGDSAWASTTVPIGNNDFCRGKWTGLVPA